MVTIKDIARESGYSISTVSRVLNHKRDVSPDAKKKIEETVEKFHFVPNNNAKQLKQNNSKTIGMLVKGISNMLFASIVEEIQRMIERTEYTLVVSYLDEEDNFYTKEELIENGVNLEVANLYPFIIRVYKCVECGKWIIDILE